MSIGCQIVPVLDTFAQEKYLGCILCACDVDFCELRRRMASAWAAFAKYKSELCSKKIAPRERVRLFESVVAPVALYACSTWTLTKQQEMALRTVQRRMLRKMFARSRFQPDSTGQAWPDYIKEATAEAESVFAGHSGKCWVQEYRARKWSFAGKAARAQDFRWTCRILAWVPAHGRGRRVGRPQTRWCDPIVRLAGGDWQQVANNISQWEALKGGFVEGM